MLRRIETQAALAETTERGKFGVRAVAQLSAHMGVLFDTMEFQLSNQLGERVGGDGDV